MKIKLLSNNNNNSQVTSDIKNEKNSDLSRTKKNYFKSTINNLNNY
jgi:hypothetical protein